ncbi:hypothetical protein LU631_20405 [Erwinia tracheiphila]|uniref:Uncharacterized protein n=1 Tax=Erwinia tracheiphila TaxID=65700 RepID=A0A345CTP3_9GAMM|nr:hypothetical protein [Erwinia tracheiphila]AXF76810.1 hypothetical protein AV903_13400 [Erwinia tracheiphila]EOS95931.1 hypothetical protein ETR_05565 [Erwinia tracheiphila PSU-1]UIA84511.1 hypothetical protein LU604_05910 [Erwinia tracheiphila]UIA87114.1 hypothetical protein LU631_20405 [Erwinia tracheiphila]UIA93104.1 hypothetical protein LU632_05895 [Erwinia tracheiphila]
MNLPADVLIRINPSSREKKSTGVKVHYPEPQKLRQFQQNFATHLADIKVAIKSTPLPELQQIRIKDLAAGLQSPE